MNIKYFKYKNSQVDSFGEIPEHWEILRLKDVADINPTTSKSFKNSEAIEFLPMSNVNEHIGQIKSYAFEAYEKVKQGYTAFKNGDVLFAKITPCMENGNCVIVEGLKYNLGFGSTELVVFRSRKILNKYLHQFLRNESFLKKAEQFMIGAAGQKRISTNYLRIHPVTIPSYSEQVAITDLLDKKTAAIDKKIALLETKIKYYSELSKAIINEAVCRGLNKNVPLKESGTEWIGKIPEHWEVKRVKDVVTINANVLSENTVKDYSFKYIDIANVNSAGSTENVEIIDFENAPSRARRIVKKGDVIISTVRTYLKAIAVFNFDVKDVIVSTGFAVLTAKKKLDAHFLGYFVRSDFFIERVIQLSSGVSYPAISATVLSSLPILLPPENEQKEIADYLDNKSKTIESIITNITTQIENLKELRKTLINDVVTGKLNVTA